MGRVKSPLYRGRQAGLAGALQLGSVQAPHPGIRPAKLTRKLSCALRADPQLHLDVDVNHVTAAACSRAQLLCAIPLVGTDWSTARSPGQQLDHAHGRPAPGLGMYARYALAGALCCALTHGAVVPVDVVKTRMQLEPDVYTRGLLATAAHLVKEEGAPWARTRARTEVPSDAGLLKS